MDEPPDLKVISINRSMTPPKKEWAPNLAIVDQLEKMLAAARAGTLQAIFAVGWNTDNSIISGWQGAESAAFTLLGGVEETKLEYVMREFERRS